MRAFILVGDTTDHGGVVIEGAAIADVDGRRIARVGDPASYTYGGSPEISPDGTMAVMTVLNDEKGSSSVHVGRIDRSPRDVARRPTPERTTRKHATRNGEWSMGEDHHRTKADGSLDCEVTVQGSSR